MQLPQNETMNGVLYKVTLLAGKFVTVCTVDIIPFVVVIFKEAERMHTILVAKVVWLVFSPVMKVGRCSISPYKLSFCVDIREAQPRLFTTVQALNEDIFFLAVDAGEISSLYRTFRLTASP